MTEPKNTFVVKKYKYYGYSLDITIIITLYSALKL